MYTYKYKENQTTAMNNILELVSNPFSMCNALAMEILQSWAKPSIYDLTISQNIQCMKNPFDVAVTVKTHETFLYWYRDCRYYVHEVKPNGAENTSSVPQIARFTGPIWGPPGSCRPQMGPMLAPWTLLSGKLCAGNLGSSVDFSSRVK